jgi:hypothetical protein
MRAFLAAVLGVIAVGVMLIAYGLLAPRTPQAADGYGYPPARPMPAARGVALIDEGSGYVRLAPSTYPGAQTLAYPVSDVRAVHDDAGAPTRVAPARQTTRRAPARTIARSGRDWTKTALVVSGTTATGAGLGAIFGGKTGALIGAAIGGGAGTLFEVSRK